MMERGSIVLLDWVAIVLYFIAFIGVGHWASKKVKTAHDFLIARQGLGKLPAALSTAATDLGGAGLVGCSGLAYTVGIAGGWWDFAATPAWIILGLFLVGRMRKMSAVTVPEILERRYGLKTRLLTAILYILGGTINITAQITVAAIAISTLTGIPKDVTIIFATAIFVFFTATGGLLAVVWTDVLLFGVLIGGVALTLPIAISKAGGFAGLLANTPSSFWDLGAMGWMTPAAWAGMCIFSYGSNQQFLQRVFAAKDVSTARFAYVFTGVNYIFYGTAVALLGISTYVLVPGLKNGDGAFAELVLRVLPMGLKGLILAALLAATMSTSDSILNSIATLFSVDIYKRIINPNADSDKTLKVARIATLAVAAVSLCATYFMGRVTSIIVLANLIYSSGVFFPLMLGLFNKRLNANGAFCAVLGGGAMALISKFFLQNKVAGFFGALHPIFAGSLASLIVLIAVSLMTKAPGAEKIAFIDGLRTDTDTIERA